MLEGVVVRQEGAVRLPVPFGHKALIIRQLAVQDGLLRLDFLDQADHGGVVRCHDVGQGQPVDVHHGAPDLLQLRLADHKLVHDGSRVGMDVVDAEYRQNIGQQGHQSQQNDRQDKALL